MIDGDVVAYKACSSSEVAVELEPFEWQLWVNEKEVRAKINAEIQDCMKKLKADKAVIALTDSDGNFRKKVLPTYKGNRLNTRKPIALKRMREWLIEESGYETFLRPGLEGDDVLGILATWPKFKREHGQPIIVSLDKDMKTIPGLYCRHLEDGVQEISPEEAEFWHMFQTLTGDTTDGYSGCPGVGAEKARKALEELQKLVPYRHEITRGKRKGQVETRYEFADADSMWDVVVSFYVAAGLSEAEALTQARVARILHYEDYDFKKAKPILWSPK
ncbi:5'-3' exonuclease [Thalassospira sp. MBR-102]|uniref:hypothetical protein n=1 Tax=Thalassospira sp. MBR-102 TaxID=3156466 RepID=UPI00339559DD